MAVCLKKVAENVSSAFLFKIDFLIDCVYILVRIAYNNFLSRTKKIYLSIFIVYRCGLLMTIKKAMVVFKTNMSN